MPQHITNAIAIADATAGADADADATADADADATTDADAISSNAGTRHRLCAVLQGRMWCGAVQCLCALRVHCGAGQGRMRGRRCRMGAQPRMLCVLRRVIMLIANC